MNQVFVVVEDNQDSSLGINECICGIFSNDTAAKEFKTFLEFEAGKAGLNVEHKIRIWNVADSAVAGLLMTLEDNKSPSSGGWNR